MKKLIIPSAFILMAATLTIMNHNSNSYFSKKVTLTSNGFNSSQLHKGIGGTWSGASPVEVGRVDHRPESLNADMAMSDNATILREALVNAVRENSEDAIDYNNRLNEIEEKYKIDLLDR